ncbi:MAG: hypothetical protein ABIC36_00050 [bacterium]
MLFLIVMSSAIYNIISLNILLVVGIILVLVSQGHRLGLETIKR